MTLAHALEPCQEVLIEDSDEAAKHFSRRKDGAIGLGPQPCKVLSHLEHISRRFVWLYWKTWILNVIIVREDQDESHGVA